MSVTTSHQHFTTRLPMETVDFKWNIPDFGSLRSYPGALQLHKISIISQQGLKWHLSMNSSMNRFGSHQGYFEVHCTLECTGWKGAPKSQQFAVWEIYNVDTSSGNVKLQTPANSEGYYEIGFSHMEMKQIATCWKPQLVNGALRMKGKLTIYRPSNESTATTTVISKKIETTSMMKQQQKMVQLLLTANQNDKFSDIKICTDDGTIIPAHRGVLVAQSDYFKAMLTNEMMETKTGKISVEGIKGKSMMSLLHFLYSGCLSEDWSDHEVLHDLAKAAYRYQVTDLVEFLDQNIAKVCDTRSAGDLMLLCKTLEMRTAEEGIKLLIKEKLKEMKAGPEFDDLLYLFATRKMALE